MGGLLTQEDPIGLAGGLNLYGFANGDPINFSDRFGLMACDEYPQDGTREEKVDWAKCKGGEYAERDAVRAEEAASRQCRAAIANAVISGIFDLGGLKSLSSGYKLVKNARRAQRFAGYGAVNRGLELPQLIRNSQQQVATGGVLVTGTRLEDVAQAEVGSICEAAFVGDVGLGDFIPYYSTFDDIRGAGEACGR